ncbi:DUF305 domain-containing protein [Occultella aeris]|uniref:DUF305 domain-containing protein n=1 Tax=Occultella aeris TaxID=2761496 RepID=A0A7M4DKQ4_9MICO|nr:DUF305 domain-containing protein [Occultella aeris]VZO37745.1 hypothetical protein HALOF300_02718 [Occultella aeris]
MKHKSLLTAAGGALALAITLAACSDAGSGDESNSGPAQTQTETDSAGEVEGTNNDADVAFAQMMIVHHQGAIEMADLAIAQAETQDVRDLAERISTAQGPEIERMTSWLETWGEETMPMDGMDHGDMDGMDMDGMSQEEAMEELQSLSGTEFDRRFLDLMTAHHEGAVEMAQEELSSGENPQALELAETIISDQEAEIAEMEQMRADL